MDGMHWMTRYDMIWMEGCRLCLARGALSVSTEVGHLLCVALHYIPFSFSRRTEWVE